MKKADEIALYHYLRTLGPFDGCMTVARPIRDLIAEHDISEKRALYLLNKWTDKGWYSYGVCLDLGWFTSDAPDELPQ